MHQAKAEDLINGAYAMKDSKKGKGERGRGAASNEKWKAKSEKCQWEKGSRNKWPGRQFQLDSLTNHKVGAKKDSSSSSLLLPSHATQTDKWRRYLCHPHSPHPLGPPLVELMKPFSSEKLCCSNWRAP